MTQSWLPRSCALQQQNLIFVGSLSVSGAVALHPPIGVHVVLGSLRTTRITFWDQNTYNPSSIVRKWLSDPGWGTGEIVGVSGRGRDRLFCIEFGQDTGKHSVVLGSSNHCQVDAHNKRGRWP